MKNTILIGLLSLVLLNSNSSASTLLMPTATSNRLALNEKVLLKTPSLIDQKNTHWCWAASTTHALSVYYENRQQSNEEDARWLHVTRKLQNRNSFYHLMQRHFPANRKGTNREMLQFLKDQFGLSGGPNWGYMKSSNPSDSITRIVQNLRRGIPSCYSYRTTSGYHCVTVVGFEKRAGKIAKIYIADSQAGSLYAKDAYQVKRELQAVFTL